MPARLASPDVTHPVRLPDGSVHAGTVFLKPVIDHPRWEIGDYSYASAHHPPGDWAMHLAPYLYPMSAETITLGKFCQIADGVQFLEGANHRRDGFSTFPFMTFSGFDPDSPSMPRPGPGTVVGHDVWIGTGARILPGARIGTGVIIGASAVVGGTVPPYSVVAGNPARIVRRRVSGEVAEALLDIAWWDWPPEAILAAEAQICGADLDGLRAAAP
ncbi:CatB-related O-acetyltransferase [Histidinibacterium aquaticum]|uniref:CatB-related O-acetyltransferase n=1 Tax=Histidinibacterium aquaticum TaxID=2613962 RepID=A0A5J5G9L7_9RHOB|nr:CatB-related O-acetyltransferase [Histidinibacterium aquaticum]KAA9004785.1 CatB-related O-acetyltransferase [Histidinibacterium aquaticum]